jgi:hypothetical protein
MEDDQEVEVFFNFSATLRIVGDELDFEEISTKLGIIPTHTHRRMI